MSKFDLNIALQIFLVLFSILYGVMLQSLSGLQPFPLGRLRRGLVTRHGEVELSINRFRECRKAYEKKEAEKKKPKSFDRWLVRMWWKRVVLSFLLLSILPIGYFCVILFLLNDKCWWFIILEGDIPQLVNQAFNIGIIFWSALGVFGFYRIYHALFTSRWGPSLFCDVADKIEARGTSFDARAHFIWGLGFYLILPLLYLFIFNSCREFLWIWVVYLISFFSIHLISSFDC